MSLQLIPPEMKQANLEVFNSATTRLNGLSTVLTNMRSELTSMRSRFTAMIKIFDAYEDVINDFQKDLYNTQIKAFFHTLYMYIDTKDNLGGYYINPIVDPAITTTPMTILVQLPTGNTTEEVLVLDNMLVDLEHQRIIIGNETLTALTADQIEEQYATPTVGSYIFTKEQFIAGVSAEMVKLIQLSMDVCRNESKARAGLKYISDLKNICV